MGSKASPVSMVVRGRLSFVNVFQPKKMDEASKAKYSVTVMLDKKDPQLKTIKATIEKLAKDEWGPPATKPGFFRNILRDGETRAEDYPEFAGTWFFSANSDRKPGLVDFDLNPIMSQEDIYSGVEAQVAVNFYTYDVKGKGVAAGLNRIRVLRKLDAFGGGGDVEWPATPDISNATTEEGQEAEESDEMLS